MKLIIAILIVTAALLAQDGQVECNYQYPHTNPKFNYQSLHNENVEFILEYPQPTHNKQNNKLEYVCEITSLNPLSRKRERELALELHRKEHERNALQTTSSFLNPYY